MVAAQASKAQAISPLAVRERTGSLSTAEIISVVQRVVTSLRTRPRFQYQELRRSMRCFVIPVSRSSKMAFLDNMAPHLTRGRHGHLLRRCEKCVSICRCSFGTWLIRSADGLTPGSASSFTMFVTFSWPSAHSG